MKVLHLAESIRGGCGTYLNEIVPHQLRTLGPNQVRCLVPAQHASQLEGFPPEVVSTFDRPGRLQGLKAFAPAAAAIVREWRPDLIHAHSTFAGAIARLRSRVRPMPPIVYCPHGWVFDVPRSNIARSVTRLAERAMSPWAARIVAISEAEARDGRLAGIRPERIVVVNNGVAADVSDEKAPWDDARRKVLFVGRLDRQKGIDVLLEAVHGRERTLSVRIVGDQVVSADGAQDDGRAGLPHVEFLGWADKAAVARHINACDVVVMPSRWEGFGLVAIEAMRAGKAVVASAVGGLVEIVVEGETGRLVEPEDPVALARALLLDDPERLAAMGVAGRERFLRYFTSDRMNAELLQIYAGVLQGGGMRRDDGLSDNESKRTA